MLLSGRKRKKLFTTFSVIPITFSRSKRTADRHLPVRISCYKHVRINTYGKITGKTNLAVNTSETDLFTDDII